MNSVNLFFELRPMPTSFRRTSQIAFFAFASAFSFRFCVLVCVGVYIENLSLTFVFTFAILLCLRSCGRFLRICAGNWFAFALAFGMCLRFVSVCAYVCIWLHFLLLSHSFSHDPCVLNIRTRTDKTNEGH